MRTGLSAIAGGRHPGVGTANAIVPLGGRQYLELITVVDRGQAERAPLRSRVLDALDGGATFAGWALRTEDLEEIGAHLRLGPIADGARERPDGRRLEWRTAELEGARSSALPFLIEWRAPEHPGGDEGPRQVRRVGVTDAAGGPLRKLLFQVELDVEVAVWDGESSRLKSVELDGLVIE